MSRITFAAITSTSSTVSPTSPSRGGQRERLGGERFVAPRRPYFGLRRPRRRAAREGALGPAAQPLRRVELESPVGREWSPRVMAGTRRHIKHCGRRAALPCVPSLFRAIRLHVDYRLFGTRCQISWSFDIDACGSTACALASPWRKPQTHLLPDVHVRDGRPVALGGSVLSNCTRCRWFFL